MGNKRCEKTITLDMANYDLFIDEDIPYLDLCCDRRKHHKGRHKDKALSISWERDWPLDPTVEVGIS